MSLPETVPMTRLEAVNLMLNSIGVNAVASLNTADMNADAEAALNTLIAKCRETCGDEWEFNKERQAVIDPSEAGEIVLADDVLRAFPTYTSAVLNITKRGNRMYDRKGRTFNIGQSVYLDLTIALAFEDLPEAAKNFVTVTAARKFATMRLNSLDAFRFTKEDEDKAWIALLQYDAEDDGRTLAQSSPHFQRFRRGRRV